MDRRYIWEVAREEVNRLCDLCQIDVNLFVMDIGADNNGKVSKIHESDTVWSIVINQSKMVDNSTIIHTARHELRHVWQRTHYAHIADFWREWTISHQCKDNDDSYLFSATELDAERFANSQCTLADSSVLVELTSKARGKSFREQLKSCQDWALANPQLVSQKVRMRLRIF